MRDVTWGWVGLATQVGAWLAIALVGWPDYYSVLATPWVVMFVIFGLAGLFLIVRRPRHPVGWLMVTLGVMSSVGIVGLLLASRLIDGGSLEAAAWADAVGNAVMTAGILSTPALIALFPDGKVPRRYGRTLLGVMGLAAIVGAGAALFNGGWGGDPSQALVPSPLRDRTAPLGDVLLAVFDGLLAVSMIGASVTLIVRWRHSRGLERQQIKWLAAAGVLAVVVLGAAGWNTAEQWEVIAGAAAFSTIPLAIVAAILRYRLYDIDRIISRTVSHAIVVAALAGLFTAIVVGLPNWVVGVDDSPLLVAASTLAVAALFNPLRRRVQVVVDRRFNRSRYDAGRVMDDFAAALRHEVDTGQVIHGWMSVVEETMQPARVAVWVRS